MFLWYSDMYLSPCAKFSASLKNLSSAAHIEKNSVMLSNHFMDTIEETRLKRLLMLMREFGNECPTKILFAEKIGKSDSQLNQWINQAPDSRTKKPRSINSQSAREIEGACGKQRGWMDQPVMDEIEKLIDAIETIKSAPTEKIIMVRSSLPADSDGEKGGKKKRIK